MPWYEYSNTPSDGGLRPLLSVRLWHGAARVSVIALVDSGADASLMDISYAEVLGLNKNEAQVGEVELADGSIVASYSWPDKVIELQFESERFPFKGEFVDTPSTVEMDNLLGRGDFFHRYIIQFWDAEGLINIDTSPDYPRDPHHDQPEQ